jgi:xanthine/uracil permease
MPQTNANTFAAGTGIVIGIGLTILPQPFMILRPFVSTGIVMGFLAAAVMHIVFNLIILSAGMERPIACARSSPTGAGCDGEGGY